MIYLTSKNVFGKDIKQGEINMKKKVFPVIMSVFLLAGILAGCGQAEDTVNDVNTSSEVEVSMESNNVVTDIEGNEAVSAGEQEVHTDDATQICSRCQRDVVCGTYEVDGKVFILCDSCFSEFAYEYDYTSICGLCENEKVCGHYEVDGSVYVVCDDCYGEFAYAMQIPEMCDLCRELVVCSSYEVDGMVWIICHDCYGEFATANNILSYCSQCTEDKICGHYMVDDLPYSVCDDCYAAFADANGLPQH